MNDPTKQRGRAETLLDAWLAGDLAPGSEEERALLAEHPEMESEGELARHRAARAALRELPAELEPERDLWPLVAARTGASGGARVLRPWRPRIGLPLAALAAALLVALGTAWWLRQRSSVTPAVPPAVAAAPSAAPSPHRASRSQASPGQASRRPTTPRPDTLAGAAEGGAGHPPAAGPLEAPRPPSPPPLATRQTPRPAYDPPSGPTVGMPALAAYAETDRELAALGAELRRTIEAQQERLPPATRQIVFDNLATIERALAEIEAALAGAPGDVELARTYIEYRQREIAVLRRANAMAARL